MIKLLREILEGIFVLIAFALMLLFVLLCNPFGWIGLAILYLMAKELTCG